MSYVISIPEAQNIAPGIWSARIPPSDLRRLGQARSQSGARSIVGAVGQSPALLDGALSVAPADIVILNLGTTEETLVLHLGQSLVSEGPRIMQTQITHSNNGSVFERGDEQFIASCKSNGLPDALVTGITELLERVRAEYDGELHEGLHRKWVNYPDNFVAITIQNRDRSFAMNVKGRPDQFLKGSLALKPDRPGYTRFKVTRPTELKEATEIVLRSARASVRR
jgi:hypothetical protein